MKKNLFIFFILLFSSFSFAFELWNGFTDDMTPEQVLERGNKLFECEGREPVFFNWLDNLPYDYADNRNLRFPEPDYVIFYPYFKDGEIKIKDCKIKFFFYKKKLFGIFLDSPKEGLLGGGFESVFDMFCNKLIKGRGKFYSEDFKSPIYDQLFGGGWKNTGEYDYYHIRHWVIEEYDVEYFLTDVKKPERGIQAFYFSGIEQINKNLLMEKEAEKQKKIEAEEKEKRIQEKMKQLSN